MCPLYRDMLVVLSGTSMLMLAQTWLSHGGLSLVHMAWATSTAMEIYVTSFLIYFNKQFPINNAMVRVQI